MRNQDIRNAIKSANLRMWHVAEALGISDSNFCRKLRYELKEEERNKIMSIISTLSTR